MLYIEKQYDGNSSDIYSKVSEFNFLIKDIQSEYTIIDMFNESELDMSLNYYLQWGDVFGGYTLKIIE